MLKTVVNIASYQIIWFLCVLLGSPGALGGLALVAVHFVLSDRKAADLRLAVLLLLIGIAVDGSLLRLGFFSFTVTGLPLPFWLLVIWLGLAITPNHSLAWMKNRPLLSVIFGFLGGPAAYWAGARLGAATFHLELLPSLLLLGLIWSVLWPVIMYLSVRTGEPVKQRHPA
jgi:hypothetical protein